MTLPEMALAILRKWWVFLPVFAGGVLFALQIQAEGAEFIAESRITVVAPRTENTLLDSTRRNYKGPAILAAVALFDDSYRVTLRDDGLPDTFDIDYNAEYPVVLVTLRGPVEVSVSDAIERVSDDYVTTLEQVQAERGVIGAARLRGDVTAVIYPSVRPAASSRALLGLVAAAFMLSAGVAYGVDQYILPARPRRFRRAVQAAATAELT